MSEPPLGLVSARPWGGPVCLHPLRKPDLAAGLFDGPRRGIPALLPLPPVLWAIVPAGAQAPLLEQFAALQAENQALKTRIRGGSAPPLCG